MMRSVRWGCGLLGCALSITASAQELTGGSPAEGEKLFTEIQRVLTHPRCLNCHTNVDFPKQGNDRHPHSFRVERGPENKGPPGLECAACHQSGNNTASGVPGAPNWHLAPLSMGWEDKTAGELCRTLLDKSRNGGRGVDALVIHLTSDELIGWAWNPGKDSSGQDREPVPIGKDEFARIVRAWAGHGAVCPR
jgi:hypothetical protein